MDNYYTNNLRLIDLHQIKDGGDSLSGEVAWCSPSNLALVKYWGKSPQQLPKNRSISITLNGAHTKLNLGWRLKTEEDLTDSDQIDLVYNFHGKERPDFAQRLTTFLTTLLPIDPFLAQFKLTVNSENSFPHSAGIASSASSMSALALALCSMEERLFGPISDKYGGFFAKASYLARLGSGSASRSVYGGIVSWGGEEQHDNLFATPVEGVDPTFATMCDAILIVSSKQKSLSSTQGHYLMERHPFAPARYQQANHNCQQLMLAMKDGDWSIFGRIVEQEAMTLHSLLMSSESGHLLIKPQTLELIDKIRSFRVESGRHLYFTLDAGPNLHLLYPKKDAAIIKSWIEQELTTHLESGRWIDDHVGSGPYYL
ncbi:MAG: diphosphomevalonate decarboxylase [Bdellovibrionales bacterium]|jgi:diphosphomevalonate decarboxylase|nr:diphosphomevalonate decarboxylase [Bdellovibrionales bacterium]MBT3526629.1 diphosphomevalonate decarboxylase [Bdellovibrionales bacterium]MBT7667981.1 diphosphomevalonate decarboxylase [Bdellovibrionales bacterium]